MAFREYRRTLITLAHTRQRELNMRRQRRQTLKFLMVDLLPTMHVQCMLVQTETMPSLPNQWHATLNECTVLWVGLSCRACPRAHGLGNISVFLIIFKHIVAKGGRCRKPPRTNPPECMHTPC